MTTEHATQIAQAPTPTVDPANPNILRWDDLGLTLIHDFITEAEEATMIAAFHAAESQSQSQSQRPPPPPTKGKKRVSQHYGYHFDYTTFGASETDFTPVPPYLAALLPRLPAHQRDSEAQRPPDQFTVQYYPPGAGIPPHVDTHSMFGEVLYSLSFGSAVPMAFRLAGPNDARKMRLPKRSAAVGDSSTVAEAEAEASPGTGTASSPTASDAGKDTEERSHGERPRQGEEPGEAQAEKAQGHDQPAWELLLPPRSLLVMTGPSRYGYTHAIRPRKTDVVDGRTVPRTGRYSVTMRTVRRGAEIGCHCDYPGVCDARIREEMQRGGRG